MAEGTKQAVVLADVIAWMEKDDSGVYQHHSHDVATDGAEVELPAKEYERLEKAGAVAKPGSAKAKGLMGEGGLNALSAEALDHYAYLQRLTPGDDWSGYPDNGSDEEKREFVGRYVRSAHQVMATIEVIEDQLGEPEAAEAPGGGSKQSGAPSESGAESKDSAGAGSPDDEPKTASKTASKKSSKK